MPPLTVPPDVKLDIDRGRRVMRKNAPSRRLCARFERGDTYTYLTTKNALTELPTVTNPGGSGKPPHRLRNRYNFIRPIIDAKVSAATQRIPSYEITPTSTDPSLIGAAKLSEIIARYGYDKWFLRKVSLKTTRLAIGHGGVGYALPYFDPDVGPYQQTEDGEVKGQGEVKILVLSGNEVYSQVGVDFDESPWYVVERARPIGEVEKIPGFIPGIKLAPDAASSDIPSDQETDNLVMTSEYFERPSQKFPDGRCMVIANNRPIVDYRLIDPTAEQWWGPYPLEDHDGSTVLDEPLLHRLVYTHDPETDTDFGLTWQLIDFERTAQDAINKLGEWKNRCLNPQIMAPVGSIVTTPDDVPGSIKYYRPIGGQKPEWERPPALPGELFQIVEWAVNAMQQVAADQQVDPAPNISARTLNTGIEQSMNRWQSFLGDLAEWHSRLMRHCLLLVARYYTTPRLLELRGRDGWPNIADFTGTQLMGQSQVRVLPDSLAPVTRQGVQDQITWINQNWPGAITADQALEALQSGSLDRLTNSYWLDVGRVNLVIQKLVDGSIMDMPTRVEERLDPATGQPAVDPTTGELIQEEVPSWMPSDNDNLNIWRQFFGDFQKTDSFQRLPPEMQEVGKLIWQGIQDLEAQQAQRRIMQQNAIAQSLGAENAAKPGDKGMPSIPGSGQVPMPQQ